MIAKDTNILSYAHRCESLFHRQAAALVRELAEGAQRWALLWPCLYEFLAITTHPRISRPRTPAEHALAQLEAWVRSPPATLLAERAETFEDLLDLARTGEVTGPRFHDAKTAALAVHHGIEVLWTADRDFGRFPTLRTENPLLKR